MPSFDVVSKINQPEVDNALLQSQKEIATRYDFKDTGTSIERHADGIVIVANSEGRVEAAYEVLFGKMVKRGLSPKQLDPQEAKPAGQRTFRQLVKFKEGIDRENAKKVIELVKESKLKVQASIHEDTVRITGKNRDDLQSAMKMLKAADLAFEAQYNNFRE